MKIVAVMEVSPTNGGGYYQALNAVLQMKRLCAGRHDFAVATADPANLPVLREFDVEAFHLPTSLFERVRSRLPASRIARRVLTPIPDPVDLEKRLIAAGAQLAYFVTPWGRAHRMRRLCYWATVWDLAHLEYAEFPEVAHQFHDRERVLRYQLAAATMIVVDSLELGVRISQHYGVHAGRLVTMPFAPGAKLDTAESRPLEEVLRRHALTPGYFFYPAQFWAHKNHVRILEALRLCADRGHVFQAVFAGGDMGSRAHVEATVSALGLRSQVQLLGFVDAGDMRSLYQGSRALVMPTYFGPTNLPPLEAWSLGVPVIYSSHLREQAGDAALLADPDDAGQLAERLIECQDAAVRSDLVTRGRQRLQQIKQQRSDSEAVLLDRLHRLELRLRCSA